MKTAYNIAYVAGIYAFISPIIILPLMEIIECASDILHRLGLLQYKQKTENIVTPVDVLISFIATLILGPHALAAIDITPALIATACLLAILLLGHGHIWAVPISMACLWLAAIIFSVLHVDNQLKNPMLRTTSMNLLRLIAATTKNKTTS